MNAHLFQSIKPMFSASARGRETVLEDIARGAAPGADYYVMLSLSALISALGLLANSPAAIIAAMLISPLMTPVFGVSMGLARGNATMLLQGLKGLLGGAALTVGASMLLGLPPFSWEATPEILMRTRPTFPNMGAAALAGAAGAIAMIDDRLSPVLPGIAIATFLTPPLAACGLCIVLGLHAAAWGACLLFFTNFLSTCVIVVALFVGAGFVTRAKTGSGGESARRFAPALIGLLVMAAPLALTLGAVSREATTSKKIEYILEEELARLPSTSLLDHRFKRLEKDNALDVLARVKTPKPMGPRQVDHIEKRLTRATGLETNLVIRCELVRDVTVFGSRGAVVSEDPDRGFIAPGQPPGERRHQLAEQTLREALEEHPGLSLLEFNFIKLASGPLMLAKIQGSSVLKPDMVGDLEQRIQRRLLDYEARLLMRFEKVTAVSGKGRVLRGAAHFNNYTTRERKDQFLLEETATTELNRIVDLTVIAADAVKDQSGWSTFVEAIGPRPPTPSQVDAAQQRLAAALNQPVTLEVTFRSDVIVNNRGYHASEAAGERHQGTRANTSQ